MNFLRDYLKILIPLLVAFAVYNAAIVPILEPSTVKQMDHWVMPAIPAGNDWWEDFFQEGALGGARRHRRRWPRT